MSDDEKLEWENAKVEFVRVGSGVHDGRGFFSIYFSGKSWGQGCNLRWEANFIDELLAVAGVGDLLQIKGSLVRVGRESKREPIAAVRHIIDDSKEIKVL